MIRPTPGFITSPTRHAAADPFQAIHFANTDLSGVALFEEALPHGRSVVLDDCGHVPQFEQTDRTVELTREFLASLPSA